jgi:glutamate-1-semialdehyde 2,1-aminomutase
LLPVDLVAGDDGGVITGFRVAPGGAQAAFGVRPDLSSFAKIVAGGLPGAAVGGRADIMGLLDFKASAAADREKVQHQGTFNANPVCAAAGTAALDVIGATDACERANRTAAALREAVNAVFEAERVPWACYGTYSGFHLFPNPRGIALTPSRFDAASVPMDDIKTQPARLMSRLFWQNISTASGLSKSRRPAG